MIAGINPEETMRSIPGSGRAAANGKAASIDKEYPR
jgi:hypothetical protein